MPLACATIAGLGLAIQTVWGGAVLGASAQFVALLMAGIEIYPVVSDEPFTLADEVGNIAIFITVWALARTVQVGRERRDALVSAQERRERETVEAERARVARELHLTTFGEDRNLYAALKAGASGFLLKTCRPDELRRAVHAVATGQPVVSAEVVSRLVHRFVEAPPPDALAGGLAGLSGRELDVLRHVARGLSNAEIGAALFLGEATVKTHLNHLLRKLGLRDRVQAAVFAYEVGLIRPGAPRDP